MKYTIIKILLVLVVLAEFSSCYTKKTDKVYPGHYRYRRAGNYW